ncbi:MAG: helix-turn-helix domain-containing protein [Acidimicrobiia bacterium]|nr:helix-turn-helix domain-containing protein [Acidimicrobiia bacterium]
MNGPPSPSEPLADIEVIADPEAAAVALDPVRSRILAALAEPGSATTVAAAVGETRQKVNYHLRLLEAHGLLRLVEERPRRGLTERVMVASARSYAVSPEVLGPSAAPDPAPAGSVAGGTTPSGFERHSSDYLLAVAARTLREVADLARRAASARRQLATLTIDTEIRFGSAAERAAFTAELASAVTGLAARYHDEWAPGGRWHRLVVAAHPRPGPPGRHSWAAAPLPPAPPHEER